MRKWIIVLGVILLLIIGAVFLAVRNLNSYLNENREWLAQQLKQAIGREVTFGEIGVSFAGGLGASVSDLSISDDPKFSQGTFLRVGEAQVLVKILSALTGKYEVRRVVLQRPEITVIQTKNGFNFDSIGKTGTPDAAPPAGEDTAAKPREGTPPDAALPILIGMVSIEDGSVRYIDRTTDPSSDVSIENLDLTASDLSPTSPMEIELAAALLGATKQNLSVEGSLGPLGAQTDPSKIQLDLDVSAGPLVIDDLKRVKAIAESLPPELSSPDPITVHAAVKGTLKQLDVQVRFDASDAALRYGETFRKPKGVPFRADVDARMADTVVTLDKAALTLAALGLAASGRIDTGTPLSVDLNIDTESASLSGWDELLPGLQGIEIQGTVDADLHAKGNVSDGNLPRLEGTIALREVSASGNKVPVDVDGLTTTVTLKGDSLELPLTKVNVAGQPVELQATLTSLDKPAGNVSLRAAALKPAALGFGGKDVRKEEVLRDLTVDGKISPGTNGANVQATVKSSAGTLRDLDYQNLEADLTTRDDVVALRNLAFEAYGGTFRGGADYDRRSGVAKFDVRSDIRGMDVSEIVASQAPKAAQNLDGKLQTDVTVAGSGEGWPAISQSLQGNGKLGVREGVLKDINIADTVLSSLTGIAGLTNFISPRIRQKYPELFSVGDTKFDELGGTFQIANGRATTNDLLMSARGYAVRGQGYFTFDQMVDFTATLVASEELTRDIVGDVKEAKYLVASSGRLEIPFRLEGKLPQARPKPDATFVTNALQRAIVDKGLDALLKRKDKKKDGRTTEEAAPSKPAPAEELIKKGLEGLLGR